MTDLADQMRVKPCWLQIYMHQHRVILDEISKTVDNSFVVGRQFDFLRLLFLERRTLDSPILIFNQIIEAKLNVAKLVIIFQDVSQVGPRAFGHYRVT